MPEGIPNNQEHPIEISKEVFEKCLGLTFAEIQKQHPKIAEALLRDNPEASNAWELTPEFREIDLMKAAYYKEESSIKESLDTQEESLENAGKNPSKTQLAQKAIEASALRQESALAESEKSDFGLKVFAQSHGKSIENIGDVEDPKKPNEDSFFIDPENGIFGVFDGIGGHAAGDVASKLASEHISEKLRLLPKNLTPHEIEEALKELLLEANEVILSQARNNYAQEGMGTTASVVKIWEGEKGEKKAIIGNVGDSRVYSYLNGKMQQITLDDSVMRIERYNPEHYNDEEYIRNIQDKFGNLTDLDALNKEEKEFFKRRNYVSQNLGADDIEPRMYVVDLKAGEKIIIMSDGIGDNLTDGQMEEILEKSINRQVDPAVALFKAAKATSLLEPSAENLRSKPDDMTVIIVEVVGESIAGTEGEGDQETDEDRERIKREAEELLAGTSNLGATDLELTERQGKILELREKRFNCSHCRYNYTTGEATASGNCPSCGLNKFSDEVLQTKRELEKLRKEEFSPVLGVPVKEEALSPGNLAGPEEGKREISSDDVETLIHTDFASLPPEVQDALKKNHFDLDWNDIELYLGDDDKEAETHARAEEKKRLQRRRGYLEKIQSILPPEGGEAAKPDGLGFEAKTEEEFRERAVKMENDLQILLCLDSLTNEDRILLEDLVENQWSILPDELDRLSNIDREIKRITAKHSPVDLVLAKQKKEQMDKQLIQKQELWKELTSDLSYKSLTKKQPWLGKLIHKQAIAASGLTFLAGLRVNSEKYWNNLNLYDKYHLLRVWLDAVILTFKNKKADRSISESGQVSSESVPAPEDLPKDSTETQIAAPAVKVEKAPKKSPTTVAGGPVSGPAATELGETVVLPPTFETREQEVKGFAQMSFEDLMKSLPFIKEPLKKHLNVEDDQLEVVWNALDVKGRETFLAGFFKEQDEKAKKKEKAALEVVDSMVKENEVPPAVKKATAWARFAKESGLLTGQAAGLSLLGTAYGMFWSGFWMMDEILKRAQEGKFL